MRFGWRDFLMTSILFYLGSILLANILVSQFGIINHLGLHFPAGAYAIGLTFTFRDLVQRRWGKWKCWIWMGIASAITVSFAPKIAIASASAFLISEGIDWLIYTTYPGSFSKRVIFSNLIGIPLDSVIFVTIAFGFIWPAIWGQTIIKMVMGILALGMIHYIVNPSSTDV
jgi:uncharacterized PurR-regulated membrane protein YhhQ (DUF165 family)